MASAAGPVHSAAVCVVSAARYVQSAGTTECGCVCVCVESAAWSAQSDAVRVESVHGVFGVWLMVNGVWCMAHGVWRMVCGVWCVLCAVWRMVCSVWCVTHDVWRMVCSVMLCGAWCMICAV